MRIKATDIIVCGNPQDTVFLLDSASTAGRVWLDKHLPEDAQRLGTGIAVEHRYLMDIIKGATGDGLVVRRGA